MTVDDVLACADVPRWAAAVVAARPDLSDDELLTFADELARSFTRDEVARAMAAHPRIGERKEGEHSEAAWSRQEQSAAQTKDDRTKSELADANRAYEERFGHVFLICATGLTAEEILASARARLDNDDTTEAAVVAEELRKIAVLRLRKLLS